MEKEYFGRHKAAGIAGVKTCTFDRLAKNGKGPIITRVGARVLVRSDHLYEWLESCEVHPPAKADAA